MDQDSEKSQATKGGDEEPDDRGHSSDNSVTDAEATAADEQFAKEGADRRAEVAKHEKEMMEIGAEIKGEGAID